MKKLFLISLFLIAIAGLASATPVTCAVLMVPNTTGNTGSTCSVTPDPGFYISSLTLTGMDDYTGLQTSTGPGVPVITYGATLTQSSSVFGATYCNVTTGTTASNPCPISISPSTTVTGLDLSHYTVQLTSAYNSVTGDSVTGASITLALSYAETQIPAGVPEPSTIGLVGGALLGLGSLRLKRK